MNVFMCPRALARYCLIGGFDLAKQLEVIHGSY